MPPLADRPLTTLLEEIAAATPAPGGGSTAAVACALAAALVEMSAGPPHERAAALRARALELAEDDLSSYARVLEAERLPPTTRAGRSACAPRSRPHRTRRSPSPRSGARSPSWARRSRAAPAVHVEGDAATAALLAEAATRAAARLVELNLAGMPDDVRLRTAGEYAARALAARSDVAPFVSP